MSFYAYWHEQQVQKQAERQVLIEQAQSWVGRRVWVSMGPAVGSQPRYGEVERIDGRGVVHIVVGYDAQDWPVYCTSDVACFGQSVVLADD